MHVRSLDWDDEAAALRASGAPYDPPAKAPAERHAAIDAAKAEQASMQAQGRLPAAPGVPVGKRFDAIIGSDLIYEMAMAESLPAAIARRLAPGGRCVVCNVVREAVLHQALQDNLTAAGLRFSIESVDPHGSDAEAASGGGNDGVMGRACEYQGGFVMFTIEHVGALSRCGPAVSDERAGGAERAAGV